MSAVISPSLSVSSKLARSLATWASLSEAVISGMPRCVRYRSATCADERLCAAPIAVATGSCSTSYLVTPPSDDAHVEERHVDAGRDRHRGRRRAEDEESKHMYT